MTVLAEYNEANFRSVLGSRNMARRYDLPTRSSLDRQVLAMQAQRKLAGVARDVAALTEDERKALADFLAAQLGVTT